MHQNEFNFEGDTDPVKDYRHLIQVGLKMADIIEKELPRLPNLIPVTDEAGKQVRLRVQSLYDGTTLSGLHIKLPHKLAASCFYHYLQKVQPSSAARYSQVLNNKKFGNLLRSMLGLSPTDAQKLWNTRLLPKLNNHSQGNACKAVLRFYADRCLGEWRTEDAHTIRSLPNISFAPYESVRSQEALIPANDQSRIISYLEDSARNFQKLSTKQLIASALLALHWQQGLRPIQSAHISVADCAIDGDDHCRIRYRWAKQKGTTSRETVRRIRPQWVPIYKKLKAIVSANYGPSAPLFCLSTASEAGNLIKKTLSEICVGTWSANNLRHSAAQRHADAGRSQEEIATFLCQSDPKTCLIYIHNTATEAERVNKALGLSRVYSDIHKIASTRTIDMETLLSRTDDEQIGAVVHGIPIAGIGACNAGQSVCSSNPVLGCYTCPKFLPLNEKAIHQQVANSLRPVVNAFLESARNDQGSPTFTQLRATIEKAEEVSISIGAFD